MSWKPEAREEVIKQIGKENIPYDLNKFSDAQLKVLNRKFQNHKNCGYQVPLGQNFEEALGEGRLCYVTFRGTPGVRYMTFAEYLKAEEFVFYNREVYPHFRNA